MDGRAVNEFETLRDTISGIQSAEVYKLYYELARFDSCFTRHSSNQYHPGVDHFHGQESRMRVLTVFGTRPETIKMVPPAQESSRR